MVKDGKIKDVKSYKTIESVNEAYIVFMENAPKKGVKLVTTKLTKIRKMLKSGQRIWVVSQ